MKLLVLTWRDPQGSLISEQLNADEFKAYTEPGWLKLNGKDGALRYIPSDKVCLIQFVEPKEEPRIVRPNALQAVPS